MFNGFKEIKNSELNSNDMNSTFDVSEILNESIEEQEKQEKKIGENATEKQKNLKACWLAKKTLETINWENAERRAKKLWEWKTGKGLIMLLN